MSGSFEQTKEDLQRTVREIFRVVVQRRWAFLIPFCIGASAVLISSHRLPRAYKANTIFERRNPIPISKVLERSGPVSMDDMHGSMKYDMIGPEAMLRVVDRMGLPKDLSHKPDGRLTRSSRMKRKAAAAGMRDMLSFIALKTGPDLDRIQISASSGDPELVVQLVNAARDEYFEFSRQKFLNRLGEANDFYLAEIDTVLKSIDLHENQLSELQNEFPYVNKETSRLAAQRAAVIEINKDNLKSRIEESKRRVARLEAQLASMPESRLLPTGRSTRTSSKLLSGQTDFERERRRLREFILNVENKIMQNRIDKGMLDRHPTQQLLLRKMDSAGRDLAMVEGKLGVEPLQPEIFEEDPTIVAVKQSERQRVQANLGDARMTLQVVEEQLVTANANLSEHAKRAAQSQDKKGHYRKLMLSLDNEKDQLRDFRIDQRKLARVLDIDAKDQGIEFITLEEAATSSKPISPKTGSILMLALGVGLAFGACAVFLREFFDHTFHTATAVTFSLGVPVLEGIDEILLPADRRRYLLRRLAMVPVICLFLGALATSGGLAYMSLEHPRQFKRIVEKASTTWNELRTLG